MTSLHKKLSTFCTWGAGLSMALVFGIILINSLLRYTTGKSLQMGEELPVYIAVYGVMFGVVLAYLQDRHINFTIFILKAPKKIQRLTVLFLDALMVVVSFTLSYSGWLLMQKRGAVEASGIIGTAKDLADITGLIWFKQLGLMSSWYFSFCFGGALLCLAALTMLFQHLTDLGEKG